MRNLQDNHTGNFHTPKCHFRTIGMGTINYRKAANRLAAEAYSTGLFATSFGLDEKYLRLKSEDFWNKHKQILKARVPGFGWWIWKSEFVRLCLAEIPDGDLIFYLDAGSLIGTKSTDIEEIANYIHLATKTGVVGSKSQPFKEMAYSSKLLLDFLDLTVEQRNENQYYAGFLIIQKNIPTINFIERWRDLTCTGGHKFLFPPLNSNEDPGFVHHMYDQAILSPLMKILGVTDVQIGDASIPSSIRMARHRYAYSAESSNRIEILFFRMIFYFSKLQLAAQRRVFRNSLHLKPNPHF